MPTAFYGATPSNGPRSPAALNNKQGERYHPCGSILGDRPLAHKGTDYKMNKFKHINEGWGGWVGGLCGVV